MTSTLEIDGKNLYPIKDAASLVSYSRDYITRLAREKKITATYVGRQWFVDLDSLKNYVDTSTLENEIRKKQLSAERKNEGQLRKVVEQQRTLHLKKAKSLHTRAAVTASLVLMFGLMTGLATHQSISNSNVSQPQVANTYDTQINQLPDPVPEVIVEPVITKKDEDETGSVEYLHTQEIRPIGDIRNGVLLFPDGNDTNLENMLSDKVIIKDLPDGTKIVVRVDAAGREVGNAMPFIVVPVESEEVQI